jgi:hypothetical protein
MVLGCLEDDRIEPALHRGASDSDEDVRRLAERALKGRREYREAGLR